jgi:hypothetical protein
VRIAGERKHSVKHSQRLLAREMAPGTRPRCTLIIEIWTT